MVQMGRMESKALLVHRVHLAPLPRVGQSTHAGGGPRVRVDMEQNWSTAEKLEGPYGVPEEELPTTSACQASQSIPLMQVERMDTHFYTESSMKRVIMVNPCPNAYSVMMPLVLSVTFQREAV